MTGLNADHIEKLMSNPKIRATIEANIEIIKDEIMMCPKCNSDNIVGNHLQFECVNCGELWSPLDEEKVAETETCRYRLGLPNQSRGYGPCEVCGNHVDQTYYQAEEKRYCNPIRKKFSWTYHKCRSYFGHRNCLISKQR